MSLTQADRRRRGLVTVTHADGTVEVKSSWAFRGKASRRRKPFPRRRRRVNPARLWYLQTDHWEQARTQARIRDGFCCVKCGDHQDLHVHHLTYERKGVEWLEDLQTLCGFCHGLAHKRERA